MVASTGPNLGVSQGWTTGEDDWGTLMNANLNLFDTVVHLAVKQLASAPPSAPVAGDRALVGASPTGAFTGHTNDIAVYRNSAWSFYTPKAGWRMCLLSAVGINRYREFDGTAWALEQSIAPTKYDIAASAKVYVGGFTATPPPSTYRRFVRFNGIDQAVDFGTLPELVAAVGTEMTIWARVRPASVSSGSDADQRPMIFSGDTSPQMRLLQGSSSPATLSGYLQNSAGSDLANVQSSVGIPAIASNTFWNAAMVIRPTPSTPSGFRDVSTYIDTVETGSGSKGIFSLPATLKMAAGGKFSAARYTEGATLKRYFNGDIESMAVWNRGLTDVEITSLVNGASPSTIASLIEYWDFNEGTGTAIGNRVSGAGAGTFVGTPVWMEEGKEAAWIVGPSATGAWSGHDGQLAVATDGVWAFYDLRTGMDVFDSSVGKTYVATVTAGVASFAEKVEGIPDAPNDGQGYMRKLHAWEVIDGGDLTTRQQWTRPWRGVSLALATPPGSFTIPGMIAWDTENVDTENGWASGNPMRITVPAGVTKVRLRAGVTMSGSAVAGQLFCTFQKNTEVGATAGSFDGDGFRQSATGFSNNTANIESRTLSVVAGDYFCVRVNSSGLGAIIPQAGSYFEMEIVEAVGAVDDYPIDLGVFIHATPAASEVVMQTVFTRAVNFAINFNGSKAKATTAATATTPFQIFKNGSNIGSLTFSAAGTDGAFVMGSAATFAVGDVLKVVGPITPDATLADIAITFTGTRSL